MTDNLREAESRYRIIADNTYDFEYWLDPEGGFVYASPSCKLITGYAPEAFLKDPSLRRKLVYPDDHESFDHHLCEVEGNRRSGELEHRIIRADGSLGWIAHACMPVYDDRGVYQGVRGSNRDITERKRAESEIAWLASFPAFNPEPVVELDASGDLHYLNPAARRLFPDLEKRGSAHPFLADLKQIAGILTEKEQKAFSREIRIGDSWFQQRFYYVRDTRCIRIYSMEVSARKKDEEELLKLNRALKALSDSNQAMMHAASEEDLLREVCRIVVEDCGYPLMWIGFAEQDIDKTVRPVAHAGFERGYVETLKITWANTERGRGPTGTAIRTGKPTICNNILTDPDFKPWRKEAVKRGYASSIVFPLLADSRAFGAINIYSKFPDAFSEKEVALLGKLASDLAYGIVSLRSGAAQRQAEEELRQTRDYLESLFDFANAPIICWDARFRITRFNHAFEHLTDYRAGEVIGKRLSMLFPRGTRERSLDEIRRTLIGEQWEVVEIPILRKDGSIRTVLWNSANVYTEDGKTLLATIAQGQDITERKQAEEELRQTRDYLESLFDFANAPIICWDARFRITRFNHAFEHLTDYRAGEVIGKKLSMLFPRGTRARSLDEIRRTLTGEQWEAVEIPILRKDGDVRTVLWNSANVYTEDGKTLLATIAQGQDITERKQAEEELKKSEERVRALLDAAPALVWITHDREARNIAGNQFAHEFLRLPERTDMSKSGSASERLSHFRICKEGVELAAKDMPVQRVASSGRGLRDYTMDIVFNDGTVRSLLGNVTPLFDSRGRPGGAIAAFVDITESKRAEEVLKRDRETFEMLVRERTQELVDTQIELEKSKRLSDIGALAATVAHELRNPLAAMNMAIANIRRKAQNPLIDQHLNNIEKKIGESDQIISNLLFYSRIRAPHYENVKIHDILDECTANVRARFPGKSVSILKRYRFLKDMIIKADPLQMRELFNNILNNAYDAVPDSGAKIEARAEVDDKYIEFYFRDNGGGIAKEDISKVFDPFFTTKAKGTGLGLSVCYQIVKLHGGTIGIESAKKKGTTVSVRLPSVR